MRRLVLIAAVAATAMLSACGEEPEPTESNEAAVAPEPALTEEAKAAFDAMSTDDLVTALTETGGTGPEGEYVDQVLLIRLQAMSDEDASAYERRVPRGTNSFRYVFQASGRVLSAGQ